MIVVAVALARLAIWRADRAFNPENDSYRSTG
jgi:hypothetical protein